ncbi:MAG: hypothetical protein L6R39_001622 [Caloplaca ligustica]|nr:MAG: hypothetical protein L6R39_001622 [Caloplaca ligustica]
MHQLTQEERDTIAANPFGDSLNALRNTLREAERGGQHDAEQEDIQADPQAADSADGPRYPKVFAAAMKTLLNTLTISEAALLLTSRTGRESLYSDLGIVRTCVAKGEFDYQQLRQLSCLVIRQAPDVDIWAAAIDLIRTISHSTPPPSVPLSFDGTPITHSSASQQGSEQTRRTVEARIFQEIRFCTHRAVDGFHAKYFNRKSWNKTADRTWEAIKDRYCGGRWRDFPDKPTQDEVYKWWFDLQKEFLPGARGAYYKSSFRDMVGDEAKRRVDLIVKERKEEAPDAKHEWKGVRVIGELKESMYDWKGTLLQIGRYVRDVFAHQPTRRFVHAFALYGAQMETWVFDRSGPYSAATFDIHEEPERFVQVLCGYVMMSDEELGLDTFLEKNDGKLFVTLPADCRGKKRKLELAPDPIAHQRAIVCRGTSCYLAKAAPTDDFGCVVKFSWTSDRRPPEANLLIMAHERGVTGLAELVGHHRVTSIAEMREDLDFSKPHKFRNTPLSANNSLSQSLRTRSQSHSQSVSGVHGLSTGKDLRKRKSVGSADRPSKRSRSNSHDTQVELSDEDLTSPVLEVHGTSLLQRNDAPFDNRILRVLAISPAGRAIGQFESIVQLMEGLRDAIRGHRSLFTEGKILHRDISENNIILTNPGEAEGFKGMLIDLDLAKEVGKVSSGARHRTGTMEFMAIEVLFGVSHTYRHDLESFFYVLIWLCARQGWRFSGDSRGQPKDSMLVRWYAGTYKEIAQNKRGDMDRSGLEVILDEFPPMFEYVKPLCRTIRDVLFPYKHGLFTGTPQDPELLYTPIIKAFDDALVAVRKGEAPDDIA